MKVSIIGTGYVGLVSGTCFAEIGLDVTCIDIDEQKINNLKKGIIPIYEPGLSEMVQQNISKGRLHFSTSIAETIQHCDVIFSAVGTPPGADGSADLQQVKAVAKEIGKHMNNYILVVTKSTVPVGTAQKVKEVIRKELEKRKVTFDFDVASNPEFLKEGDAINDFLKPDRIVLGVETDKAKDLLMRLYKPFTLNGHPIICMDIPSAEMTKYAANAMLALRISFINEVANLCEIVGADINMVRNGIGSDPRIGTRFIYPGIGYGGSCFPKDVKALIKKGEEHQYPMKILQAVETVNDEQKYILFKKAQHYFKDLKGKRCAIWGLSFKPETDDVRDAPSLVIIDKLLQAGATVVAYDPIAEKEAKKIVGDKVTYASDMYSTLKNADCLFLLTEWKEFRCPDIDKMKKYMKNPVIFDGRNIFDKNELKQSGFTYYCIGKKNS